MMRQRLSWELVVGVQLGSGREGGVAPHPLLLLHKLTYSVGTWLLLFRPGAFGTPCN